MKVCQPSEHSFEPITSARRPWAAPEIRRLEAGAAENGPSGAPDALTPPS